jgi:hypothetical protein
MWFRKKKPKDVIEQVLNSPTDVIGTQLITTPARYEFLAAVERIVWKENGDMVRYHIYSVFPKENVDDVPILNLYAQKILNDRLKERGITP